jgi:PilZ domain-containing protein
LVPRGMGTPVALPLTVPQLPCLKKIEVGLRWLREARAAHLIMDSSSSPNKTSPVAIALVGLDDSSQQMLLGCLQQVGIHGVALRDGGEERLQSEAFDACVLSLDQRAPALLERMRASGPNKRTLVYGIAQNVQELTAFTRYGINIVWLQPLERSAVQRSLRATHLMVLNELRKHARLPLVVPAEIEAGDHRYQGTSREISGGGISVKSHAKLQTDQTVKVQFSLPGGASWVIPATVCWKREIEEMLGLHFDPRSPYVAEVRHWVEDYLASS